MAYPLESYGLSSKEIRPLVLKALENNDEEELKKNLINNLEISAFEISPSLKELKEDIIKEGLDKVLMTGSGSTIFALSKDESSLLNIAKKFNINDNFVLVTKFKI